jgi:DnaK suppressor protein
MSAATAAVRTASASRERDRTALERLREDLSRNRGLGWAAVSRFPDPVMMARTRRLDIILDAIEAASARLEAGAYGLCIHCGRSISPKRLATLPYISGCNRCLRALQK